jgi:cell division protein FtsB
MKYKEIRAGIEAGQGTQWLHRVVRASRYVLVFMGAAALVCLFYPSDAAQTALRHKIDALKAERDGLKAERDAQVRKLEWVRSDVKYLEIAARDRLGLQKDDEFVIRFQSKDAPEAK